MQVNYASKGTISKQIAYISRTCNLFIIDSNFVQITINNTIISKSLIKGVILGVALLASHAVVPDITSSSAKIYQFSWLVYFVFSNNIL